MLVVHVTVATLRPTPEDWTAEMTGPSPLSKTTLSKLVHQPLVLPMVTVAHVPSQAVVIVTRVPAPRDCARVVWPAHVRLIVLAPVPPLKASSCTSRCGLRNVTAPLVICEVLKLTLLVVNWPHGPD